METLSYSPLVTTIVQGMDLKLGAGFKVLQTRGGTYFHKAIKGAIMRGKECSATLSLLSLPLGQFFLMRRISKLAHPQREATRLYGRTTGWVLATIWLYSRGRLLPLSLQLKHYSVFLYSTTCVRTGSAFPSDIDCKWVRESIPDHSY